MSTYDPKRNTRYGKYYICGNCKKKFYVGVQELQTWAYKKDGKTFCSWSCLSSHNKAKEKAQVKKYKERLNELMEEFKNNIENLDTRQEVIRAIMKVRHKLESQEDRIGGSQEQ